MARFANTPSSLPTNLLGRQRLKRKVKGSDHFVRGLEEKGVECIFGVSGEETSKSSLLLHLHQGSVSSCHDGDIGALPKERTLSQWPAPAEAISEDEITSVYCPTDGTGAAFRYQSNSTG